MARKSKPDFRLWRPMNLETLPEKLCEYAEYCEYPPAPKLAISFDMVMAGKAS